MQKDRYRINRLFARKMVILLIVKAYIQKDDDGDECMSFVTIEKHK